MKTKPTFLFLWLILVHHLSAQITGFVTNKKGEALPFASIYVQGTSTGTTTNVEGDYSLELENGTYRLVFQYVGYKQKIITTTVEGEAVELNVVLEEETIDLQTVEVLANAEDPAYAIIRKAIAKRKYYKELVEEYRCDVYIKGVVKLLDAPEKILGQDVGDFEGSLDSNRQGIIYLSESESKLNFRQPDSYKEVMVSSKVSGNDNGFSFNSARDMDIGFYDNHSLFGRNIISPIANTALQYYRYKLHGTFYDEEGRLINKIEIIPKRSEDPVFRGFIYIVEGLWNIQSVNVYLTGTAMKLPAFDTLFVEQIHVPIKDPDIWRLFSQTYKFKGGALGFKFGGSFTGVYTNYDLNPPFEDGFFGNEVLKVEKEANEKDWNYWDTIRPIPLTNEEETDYFRKDSIREIRESKEFLDSIDARKNKFKLGNFFFGYTYNNSYERRSLSVNSPLTSVQFNTVQGFFGDLRLSYRKNFDKERRRWLRVSTHLNYGFSEKKFRNTWAVTYNFNRINFARMTLSGGTQTAQYNDGQPVSETLNTFYSLVFRRNYIKIYEKTFFRFQYRQEIANGLFLTAFTEFAKRSPLQNNSNYSYFYKDSREFITNFPNNAAASNTGAYLENKAATVGLSLRFRWRQKYLSYPEQKYIIGSKLPGLWLHYRRGFDFGSKNNTFRSDVDFDYLGFQLKENYASLGLVGYLEFNLEGGWFINDEKVFFPDYQHFNGNQTNIGNPQKYLNSFLLLPYYEYSTTKPFFQGHVQHHFEGFLLDKLPGMRKLGWNTVFGASFLYTSEQKDYLELSLGIDNIGLKLFRFLRFDIVTAFKRGKHFDTGFMVGLNLPTN